MNRRRIELMLPSVSLTDSSLRSVLIYLLLLFFSHSVCTGYYFRKILVFFFFSTKEKGERNAHIEKFDYNKSICTSIDSISIINVEEIFFFLTNQIFYLRR